MSSRMYSIRNTATGSIDEIVAEPPVLASLGLHYSHVKSGFIIKNILFLDFGESH